MSEFQRFCREVHRWLADVPTLDPPLVAIADLLARRDARGGPWFQCEVEHIAARADDLHAVLGAQALLAMWAASKAPSEPT